MVGCVVLDTWSALIVSNRTFGLRTASTSEKFGRAIFRYNHFSSRGTWNDDNDYDDVDDDDDDDDDDDVDDNDADDVSTASRQNTHGKTKQGWYATKV